MSTNFSENAGQLFEKLEKFFTSKTVVGEPITVGSVTLIPMVDISFGLGTGSGDGTDEKGNKGVGGGGGVGAKATPTAIIVIKNEEVQVLPISQRAGMEKLLEMVPDIVAKVNLNKETTQEAPKEE
ncbi:conserved hypothetical protein [Alkaliphilus metalliredigens QYMF]|uniref:Sporulation protein YtfJ n=1 Tax=Alkaliphilus metalliredigens (strain QYMF) TaxID=293826 RepID=A6TSB2_ALKMQ|nr:spore germination protein GerW family protein [Alkaliphilus metalliredigens]ABR49080.1 conserved hypothetical protein [Alkaliphilus metalliredigens QYMF]